MSRLVRSITVGLAAIALAGCYRSHGWTDGDAEPPRDGGPADGRIELPRDAAPDGPIPTCGLPVSEWTLVTVPLDGLWRSVRLARDGESRWLVGAPLDGGALRALPLDPASASPLPREEIELEGTAGADLLAADADGFRIATVTHPPLLWVHDVAGALRSRVDVPVSPDDSRTTIALRDLRVGLVIQSGSGIVAEVRDVDGGPPISSTSLDGWTHGGIGEGRGLFAFLASEGDDARSHYFGLDELGAIRAERLEGWFQVPHADGSTFVGVSLASVGLRHPGGRLEALGLPPSAASFSAPTVAVGPLGVVVATATQERLWLSLEGEWVEIGESRTLPTLYTDQAESRVGAYYLEGELLRWSGLTCAPRRALSQPECSPRRARTGARGR